MRSEYTHPSRGFAAKTMQYSHAYPASYAGKRPRVMSVPSPNNFDRAVQTDPTLLCHPSVITGQKKYIGVIGSKV